MLRRKFLLSLFKITAILGLVRESGDRYDAKAVRVDWNGHKLGYVPRIENHAVAQLLDRGVRLTACIEALTASRDPWERVRFAVLMDA